MDQNIIINVVKEKELNVFINSILPPVPQEEMLNFVQQVVKLADEECKKIATEDPLNKAMKLVWMDLCKDVYDHKLWDEFADFMVTNRGLDIYELNYEFRNEWDI